MRFVLLDKVTELVPGQKIVAVKALSLAEEYLGDHFPTFPVLPGVMMIEALVQTAAMLVRVTNDFSHSMVVLQEARNVKYKSFVKPGNLLTISVTAKSIGDEGSSFQGAGTVDGRARMSPSLPMAMIRETKKTSATRSSTADRSRRAKRPAIVTSFQIVIYHQCAINTDYRPAPGALIDTTGSSTGQPWASHRAQSSSIATPSTAHRSPTLRISQAEEHVTNWA